MAYTYTRQSTFSDGDTVTAALFNNEYNQLLNAFAYSSSDAAATGHRHDGTAAQGGSIYKVGDLDFLNKIEADSTNNRWGFYVQVSSSAVEQIRVQDGAIVPVTDNDIDLGTGSLEFKDAFFDGTVTTDALVADTADINGGTVDGATIGANSATTIVGTTITANTAFVPDASDGAALGTTSLEFSDLYLADGALIYFGDDQDINITHVADTGLTTSGTFQATTITATTAFVPDASGGADIGTASLEFGDVYIADDKYINFGSDQNVVVGYDENGNDTLEIKANVEGAALGITFSADEADDNADTWKLNFADSGTITWQSYTSGSFATKQTLDTSGNLTITGELDAATLDISGNADIDGTTNLDAVDIDGTVQIDGATTFGVDDTGVDVKFFGATASAYLLWDESADKLLTAGGAVIDVVKDKLLIGGTAVTTTAAELNILDGKSFVDEDDLSSDSATAIASQQSIKAYVDANVSTGTMSSWVLEDGDGTEVSVTNAKEVKFVEGGGIDINWTDTDNGTDGDPYDLTFTINAAQTDITSLLATDIKIGEDDQTKIDFETPDTINFYAGNEKQLVLTDGALTPGTNAIVDLGTDALEFKDAYFDGTVEADAITIAGVTLAETIADTVGAMVGSNTETGIAVTYEDGDNTLDFALGAAQTTITSLLATDIKIGEDDQTKIDFETADEIHFYAANVEQVYVADNIFGPQSDSDVDLGSTSVRWKDAYIDSITVTGEIDGASLDIEGNADINGTTNLDAVDIDGAVQVDATVTVGVDDTGYDVKFFGATSGKYMEWDESADQLEVVGTATVDGTLQLKNGSTSAGFLEFFEDSDNGTNKVTLIGPASTADITLTLPSSDGDSGQFLQTNGSGVMSWEDSTGMSTSKAFYMGQL